VDRRDEAIAKLALALRVVDTNGLNRAIKLSAQFPGRSLDRLLEDGGIIDAGARRKLVIGFNDRLRQMQPPPFPPLPLPGEAAPQARPKTGADVLRAKSGPPRPAPAAAPPPRSAPPAPARPNRTGRDLSNSDLLPLPSDEAELMVPLDDVDMGAATDVLKVPDEDDRFDPNGSDDTTGVYDEPTMRLPDEPEPDAPDEDAIFAEPTMVLRDEPEPPVVMVESGEVEPAAREGGPSLTESQEDALFAEPTIVLQDDKAAQDDEDALLAQPTMVLIEGDPPPAPQDDEEAILNQPTLVLKDGSDDDVFAQPTLVLKDDDGKRKSDSHIAIDLRLGRDVAPTDQKRSNRLMPGVKSRKGEGPLTRDEFQRRLKMRQGFDGFTIGDYKILKEIARGAFGVVLEVEPGGTAKSLARERGYEGNLALKVMLENKADPRETQRFLDEVKVITRFDHPHIVRMFDAGVEQGLTYYSMEFIKGTETRSHVLKHGPMPPLLAVRVAKEIAAALGYVHSQRTYHRDLKPQNIMLDQRTQPYKALLIDFGLVTEHLSVADKGLILGTPSYMPPEQAQPRGGHGEVNVTSDLYSLGASLYFLLTGQPPFSGKDPRLIIKAVVGDKPKDPTELNPNVPKNVSAIVLKCLEKKQRDRYHAARLLEQDLESVLKSGQMMLKAKSFLGKFLGKPKK
jgi:hypothetical protein